MFMYSFCYQYNLKIKQGFFSVKIVFEFIFVIYNTRNILNIFIYASEHDIIMPFLSYFKTTQVVITLNHILFTLTKTELHYALKVTESPSN